jgi:multicomponent Na+:H+ antiporter subunit G
VSAKEWLTVIAAGAGVFFMVVAAVGLNRMPDFYTRMHGATKSTTLGISFILLGSALHFGTPFAITKAVLVVVFFFLTAPVAAHALARAAYFRAVPTCPSTALDELKGHYRPETHELEGEVKLHCCAGTAAAEVVSADEHNSAPANASGETGGAVEG